VFYIGIAKINRGVAQVAMAIHVCFKCIFQLICMFQVYVPTDMHVASVYFKCF
jgi:hypothetical protein